MVRAVNLRTATCARRSAGRITQKLTDIGEIVFGFTSAGNAGSGGHRLPRDFDSLQSRRTCRVAVAKLAIGTPAETVLDAFPDRRYARRWRKSPPARASTAPRQRSR